MRFMPINMELTSHTITLVLVVFLAQSLKEMGIPSFGLMHTFLFYAGYQLSVGNKLLGLAIILFAYIGSLCGSLVIYGLFRSRRNKLPGAFRRFVRIKPEAMDRAKKIVTSSSFLTISIGRSIPGLMVPTSILAGVLEFPPINFLGGVFFTLSLWVFGLVTIGSQLHFVLPKMKLPLGNMSTILLPILVLCTLAGIFIYKRKSHFLKE